MKRSARRSDYRTMNLRPFLLLLVLPTFGFTQCQYFTTVTVPRTDTTVPVAAASVYIDGQQQIRLGSILVTLDTLKSFVPIGAIFDGGGARSVTTQAIMQVTCRQPSGAESIFSVHFVPLSDHQVGGPGSSVSNGIYTATPIDFVAQARLCGSNAVAQRIEYRWGFGGDDFFGNTANGSGAVIYQRP